MTVRLELPYFLGEKVKEEASKPLNINTRLVLYWMVIAIPLVLGWLAAKTVIAARFLIAAIKVGYTEGMRPSGQHSRKSTPGS